MSVDKLSMDIGRREKLTLSAVDEFKSVVRQLESNGTL
jgi:hypothetical protein